MFLHRAMMLPADSHDVSIVKNIIRRLFRNQLPAVAFALMDRCRKMARAQ